MPFLRGLTPTPLHLLAASIPFRPSTAVLAAIPNSFASLPHVGALGNDRWGDCVSAQEGAAKCAYSNYYGLGTVLTPTDAEVIAFARSHGLLMGANIVSVMDIMASDGMDIGGTIYKDGPYQSVDWTNFPVLSAAIYQGPVNISVAAGQVERSHSTTDGWFGLSWGRDHWFDHCVCLTGYGPLAALASACGVTLPSGANPGDPGVILHTWGSNGIVSLASLISVTGEAWLRLPTTAGYSPPQPTPPPPPPGPPGPGPVPVPSAVVQFYADPVAKTCTVILPPDWTLAPMP